MGRACISHYKKMKRHCVFSHEELICTMSADSDHINLLIAVETYKELLVIFDYERQQRQHLLDEV